jgi:hypothetical protein
LWSLVGIVAAGLLVMGFARFVLRPAFFHIKRESDTPGPQGRR